MEVCVPKVPAPDHDDLFRPDPWMLLAEVVQRVVKLDRIVELPSAFGIARIPRPKRSGGARRLLLKHVPYSWVDSGDDDHAELKRASEKVRLALAEGVINAFAKDGNNPAVSVAASDWSGKIARQHMLDVPWLNFPGITGTILLLRKDVIELWPRSNNLPSDAEPVLAAMPKWTVPAIKEWIALQPLTDRNLARKEFLKQDGAKGLTQAFEAAWREKFKRGRGRPHND